MQYLAVLTSILGVAAATAVTGDWTLYCGSTCDGTTATATGTLTTNDLCGSFGSSYDYCRFEGTDFFRAEIWEDTGCDGTSGVVISPGDCTSAGSWESHTITALL